ncbi:MAG TPA: Rid family detoxifying hydrolase [Thermoanaerobaculia bacterium]|jgi:2-iminobutanoate/2-iminopropanoate deaminase|nr:Rid family detoxifying hydrolase [Thermoanaerobaculia bacterium]
MKKRIVFTPNAPRPLGPYSQGVIAGGFLYVAGQVPYDPASGTLVEGTITEQTTRVLDNVTAILGAAGVTRADVVQARVYLRLIADFAEMNAVYATYFTDDQPARTTVEAALRVGVNVEIDVVAYVGG